MTPIASECGEDGTLCPLGAHAAVGYCLAATGEPVLVVTTLMCPPGDPEAGVDVTLIDPSDGSVVAPQAIVPCGDADWEINQLCDYDVDGTLIATFLQLFEWDEDSGALQISLVRADDPDVPYIPSGEVRACSTDQVDVEITQACIDTGGSIERLHEVWLFHNGVLVSTLYYDFDGDLVVAPTLVPCPEPAYQDTLLEVLAETEEVHSELEPATSFSTNQVTAAVAAAQIVVASTPSRRVVVKAHVGNNAPVYVGPVGVTIATGFELDAGESATIAVDDANKIYIITSAIGGTRQASWMVVP